jgi:uncharacterized membrane protein (DUF2068 family)
MASTVHRSRPFGITILAILLFLSGLLDLVIIVLGLFAVRTGQIRFTTPRMAEASQATQASTVLAVAILLALAILPLLLARGLWNLKPWAYWGMVLLEAINVVFGIMSLMNHAPVQQTLLTLALPVLILLYLLLDHNVHVAFRQ